MAKKKTKKEKEDAIEEIRGRFIIKTDKGYYVKHNNTFELKEIYSDDESEAEVFMLNIIGIWFMEALKSCDKRELIKIE